MYLAVECSDRSWAALLTDRQPVVAFCMLLCSTEIFEDLYTYSSFLGHSHISVSSAWTGPSKSYLRGLACSLLPASAVLVLCWSDCLGLGGEVMS